MILQVSRKPVTSASDASRLLQQVPSGGTAFILVWRQGNELFVTVRKD